MRTFGYDIDNHLISGTAQVALQNGFSPLGRRLWAEAAGQTAPTYFVYDGEDISEEYANSVVLRRHVPSGIGETPLVIFAAADESSPLWVHTDNQGSPIAWSGATGTQQGTWSYDAFGLQGQPTNSAQQYTYTGQTCYCLGALYNYKARTYDPNFGRFLSADPIGQAGGVNTYAYVGNDPVNGSDPTGMAAQDQTLPLDANVPYPVGGITVTPFPAVGGGLGFFGTPYGNPGAGAAGGADGADPHAYNFCTGNPVAHDPRCQLPQNVVDCLPGSSDAKVPVTSLLGDKTYLWPAPAANPNISFNGSTEFGAAFLAGGTVTSGTVRYTSSDGLRWGGSYINLAEARGFGASGGTVVQSSASSWGAFWGPGDGLTLPAGPYTSGTGTQNESGTNESVSAGVGTMAAYVNGSTGAAGCPTAIH